MNQEKESAAKKSKLRKMLEDGCIAAWYTLRGYFVRVYPALEIDKVRFSFVEKGTNGNGFDVYVDTVAFMLLCEDVQSGALARRIANDTGTEPSAWTYKTGENASKSVAIGKSRSGTPLIKGRDTMQKKSAMIPLDGYVRLREMALLFDIVSGRVQGRGYLEDLKSVFEQAQRARRRHSVSADDEPTVALQDPTNDDFGQIQEGPAKAAQHGAAKEYVCSVLSAPQRQEAGLWSASVQINGRALILWAAERGAKLDELEQCARNGGQASVRIAVHGEGPERKAWLCD